MVATATHSDRSAPQREAQNPARTNREQVIASAATRSRSGDSRESSSRRAPAPNGKETTPAKDAKPALQKTSTARDSSHLRRQVRGQSWRLAQRHSTEARRTATRSPIERTLILSGFVVATLLVLAFGLDLATGWPFHRYSLLMDVAYLICGALLMYLSWNTYREFR